MATKTKQLDIIEPRDIFVGAPGAGIVVTAYIDYESEVCAQLNEVLNELLKQYEGKVKLNIRHFPLTKVHQHAMKAAEAAVAAGQEGKFWAMHNLLFHNRRRLGTISLKEYAREAGVTNKRFLDEMVNSTYGWQVRGDLLDALDKGVREVPSVFVNEAVVKGKPTYAAISKLIDAALAA
jgi:protein-disulfide isomerase